MIKSFQAIEPDIAHIYHTAEGKRGKIPDMLKCLICKRVVYQPIECCICGRVMYCRECIDNKKDDTIIKCGCGGMRSMQPIEENRKTY